MPLNNQRPDQETEFTSRRRGVAFPSLRPPQGHPRGTAPGFRHRLLRGSPADPAAAGGALAGCVARGLRGGEGSGTPRPRPHAQRAPPPPAPATPRPNPPASLPGLGLRGGPRAGPPLGCVASQTKGGVAWTEQEPGRAGAEGGSPRPARRSSVHLRAAAGPRVAWLSFPGDAAPAPAFLTGDDGSEGRSPHPRAAVPREVCTPRPPQPRAWPQRPSRGPRWEERLPGTKAQGCFRPLGAHARGREEGSAALRPRARHSAVRWPWLTGALTRVNKGAPRWGRL